MSSARRSSWRLKYFSMLLRVSVPARMPLPSKNMIWMRSGSRSEIFTWIPPGALELASSNRVTAVVATRRSSTDTPVDVMPAIIARLIMREAGCASRLTTTWSPRRSVVPYAIARRVAVSGVMSTFTIPVTPSSVNSVEAPRGCQISERCTWAPISTRLNG